jgi:hypothetical protein
MSNKPKPKPRPTARPKPAVRKPPPRKPIRRGDTDN